MWEMDGTLTPVQAAAVGGVYGAVVVFAVIWLILSLIAGWKIFKKAGEPGWKILIPIYNVYVLYKIIGMKAWFWISILVGICYSIIISVIANTAGANGEVALVVISWLMMFFSLFVEIYFCWKLSVAFRHGIGYALGLFFLQGIFMMIIAFGRSKYDKKVLK